MPLREAKPVRWTPKGLADAWDSTDVFPGACRSLQDLIFDLQNPEIVVPRPGLVQLTNFPGFSSPGYVSIQFCIGNICYGMLATGRNSGKDEPFAYDIVNNVFITISGVTGANTPTSPATSGAWTPPTAAVIGTKIIITHPGFNGTGSNFFGVIDISNPAAPAWSSSNLATNPLTVVPSAVANYRNRAYFAIGSNLAFSDVLVPTTRTNASQQVTLGDPSPIVALVGLPIQTTSGGVVGALIAFKVRQIWQVTGDVSDTTNPYAQNFISLTDGTSSPRSIVQSESGLFWIGDDGPYFMNPYGAIGHIVHGPQQESSESDIRQPFTLTTAPSRIAADHVGNIYRVCVPTLINGVSLTRDYWFDLRRRRWNGPHTVTYDCVSNQGSYFVISGPDHPGMLIKSAITPLPSTVYTDLGQPINVHYQTCALPKTGTMNENEVIETTLELSSAGIMVDYTVSALGTDGTVLNSVVVATAGVGALWGGGALWGDGTLWTTSINQPKVYPVEWSDVIVFSKLSIDVQAVASQNVSIGTTFLRYQDTGYTNQFIVGQG